MSDELTINGITVEPGSTKTLYLPLPQLYTHTPMEMPVHVIRGKRDGPRLFVCAAIHGDELNGVEIIRRLMKIKWLNQLRGTLIAIPIVNIYGVIHHNRYLPDRRDLNRSFPGSNKGSMTSRLAHLLMTEIVSKITHAVDLHTGAINRSNMPQIRADLGDSETKLLADRFGVPVVIDSKIRDGSLRSAANELGVPVLLYEAGEAMRFEETCIRAGLNGIINVMSALDMLPRKYVRKPPPSPITSWTSSWTRAPISGVLLNNTKLKANVNEGDELGVVADPFSLAETIITAHASGIVIGRTNLPLVNEGDAVFHIARVGTN